MEDVPRNYIEKLYENTVDGPCQTVSFVRSRPYGSVCGKLTGVSAFLLNSSICPPTLAHHLASPKYCCRIANPPRSLVLATIDECATIPRIPPLFHLTPYAWTNPKPCPWPVPTRYPRAANIAVPLPPSTVCNYPVDDHHRVHGPCCTFKRNDRPLHHPMPMCGMKMTISLYPTYCPNSKKKRESHKHCKGFSFSPPIPLSRMKVSRIIVWVLESPAETCRGAIATFLIIANNLKMI